MRRVASLAYACSLMLASGCDKLSLWGTMSVTDDAAAQTTVVPWSADLWSTKKQNASVSVVVNMPPGYDSETAVRIARELRPEVKIVNGNALYTASVVSTERNPNPKPTPKPTPARRVSTGFGVWEFQL